MSTKYVGTRNARPGANNAGPGRVTVFTPNGKHPLPPRNDVMNHSPDGFQWGYGGSGPAQLALAMCIDALDGDVERARNIYHDVKQLIVAQIKEDTFEIDKADVVHAIVLCENRREA